MPIADPVYVDREPSRIMGCIEIQVQNVKFKTISKDRNRREQNNSNNQRFIVPPYSGLALCAQRYLVSIAIEQDRTSAASGIQFCSDSVTDSNLMKDALGLMGSYKCSGIEGRAGKREPP